MPFSTADYGPEVASLLALDGGGERLMPLAYGTCCSRDALARLKALTAGTLFPRARDGGAALAGLYLYFSCLEECHTLAQDIDTAEGGYWHAIMHRQEPDPRNATYWFRRVGTHPIFPALREAAVACGYPARAAWDPFAFITYCGNAREHAGSPAAKCALEVQRAEWQLLFDYCARPA